MSSRPSRLSTFLYRLLPLVIAAGVLFVLVAIGGKAVQGYEMKQEARALEQRVDQLKKENRRLTQDLDYLRSDQYIEKVAREDLGLVRPGDVAVAALGIEEPRSPSLQPTPTPSPTPGAVEQDIPNWQRWLSLFTGED